MEQYSNTDQHLRVASYNIRKCIGLDRRRVPERVLGVISGLDADIVALQEADKRLGNRPAALPHRLIEHESDFEPVSVALNDESLGWHGNAILVKKGAKVTKKARLDLPGLEPRGAALAEIHHKGREIRIVATHLGLMRRHRQAQLAEIRADIENRPKMATIILGDFNEWSDTGGLDHLRHDYTVHTPGRSFHAARPIAALDRIAANRSLELADGGVHQKGAALKASDHLPVWADFSWHIQAYD